MTQYSPAHLQLLPRRLLLGSQEIPPPSSPGYVALYALVSLVLVLGAGLASGLTLGLMSLDVLELKVLHRSGTPKEQKLAARILPILKDPHWLLVTLLLWNAACFEALPIFLDVLIDPLGAILISVTLILLFGEILPQAVCARHGLRVGVAFGPLVRFMMWLFCPIAWLLARCLDWLLGKEGYTLYGRKQLKALVNLHGADEGLGGKLSDDEVQIICGALDLTHKVAWSAMTPLDKVVMLRSEQRLDGPTIDMVLASGHSRLPVYVDNTRTQITGLLLVKELLKVLPIAGMGAVAAALSNPHVSDVPLRHLPRLPANTPMYALLKLFETGRAHMVLLTQPEPLESEQHTATVSTSARTSSANKFKDRQNHGAMPTAENACNASNPVSGHSKKEKRASGDAAVQRCHSMSGRDSDSPHAIQLCPIQASSMHQHQDPSPVQSQNFQQHQSSSDSMQATRCDLTPGQDGISPAATTAQITQLSVDAAAPAAFHQSTRIVTEDASTAPSCADWPSAPAQEDTGNDKQPVTSAVQAAAAAVVHGLTQLPASIGLQQDSMQSKAISSISVPPAVVPLIAVPGEPIGIITIEDVLEELMGQEILDESDAFADNERTITVDEKRQQMAQRLPEALRSLVVGPASGRPA